MSEIFIVGLGGYAADSSNSSTSPEQKEEIGKWSGKDVVQVGTRPNGNQTRWRFTEITPDSFHWLGEAMQSDGSRFCLRRITLPVDANQKPIYGAKPRVT